MAVSLYVAYSESSTLKFQVGKLRADADMLMAEQLDSAEKTESLANEVTTVEEEVGRLFDKIGDEPEERGLREQLLLQREVNVTESRAQVLKNSSDLLHREHEQLVKRTKEAQKALVEPDLKNQELERVKPIVKIGFFSGGVLAFFGFLLWYRRVQRYHDRILKREAEGVA